MKSFAEYAAQGFLFLTPGLPAPDAHLGYRLAKGNGPPIEQ
jgi:hypothetical protein